MTTFRFVRPFFLISLAAFSSCVRGGPVDPAPAQPRTVTAHLVPQLGHSSHIVGAVYTSDGRRVLTWGNDGAVGVWDADTGTLLHRIPLGGPVTSVASSPDGGALVATSGQRSGVWDARTGRLQFDLTGTPEPIEEVSYSPDGTSILGLTDEGGRDVMLWNSADGALRWQRDGGVGDTRPHSVTFVDDGAAVFVAQTDGAVHMLDSTTGAPTSSVALAEPSRLAFLSPSGTWIATLPQRRTEEVLLWRAETGELAHRLPALKGVRTVRFSDTDDRLLVWSQNAGNREALVYDVASGEPALALAIPAGVHMTGAFSGDQVLLGNNENYGTVWSASGELLHELRVHEGFLYSLVASPDRSKLLSASRDGTAAIWDAATGELLHHLRPRLPSATDVATTADSSRLAVVGSDGKATVWDAAVGRPLHRIAVAGQDARAVAFAPDGSWFAAASADGAITTWDTTTGQARRALQHHRDGAEDVDVSPDGTLLATSGADRVVRVWGGNDEPVHQFDLSQARVRAVRFAPDGQSVAAASWDRRVRIHSLDPEVEPIVLDAGSAYLNNAVAWFPDGTRLATGVGPRTDGGPTRWTLDGDAAETPDWIQSQVTSIAVAPDGRHMVTGRGDHLVHVYDTDSGALQHSLEGHTGAVTSVRFTGDGQRIVSSSVDGTVRFWDAAAGRGLGALMSYGDSGWAVVDVEGRYDASEPDSDVLSWVIDGRPYRLSQLRDQYYSPGLATSLMTGDRSALRAVPSLSDVRPPPVVRVAPRGGSEVEITVEDQGGGVGSVFVSLNHSDISRQVGAECPTLASGTACRVDLSAFAYYAPGHPNDVHAWASDGSDRVSSRGLDVVLPASDPERDAAPPELWAVIVGTSDYAGEALDLMYPGRDATRIGEAVALAGRRGFGGDRVHVSLFTTEGGTHPITGAPVGRPTLASLEAAFEQLTEAAPTDTVLVYLAGHGVSRSDGQVDDFFYLLPDAASMADVADPQLRALRTISGAQLEEWMLGSPAARRVVILDTCESGKAADQLSAVRSALSGDALRAHARARSRTGAWILAGAAADQVAYEASRYGQGILTYALLEAFAGPALSEGQVMVGRLFAHAENRVPELARGVGGLQRPFPRRGASDFPLGELADHEREKVRPVGVKPVIVQTDLDLDGARDRLGISRAVDAALRDVAGGDRAPLAFIDAPDFPGSWALTGDYTQSETGYTVSAWLEGDLGASGRTEISVEAPDVPTLAARVAERVANALSER